MSASKCARCDKTVYPVEGLRCLDKIWHKGCFKCHECNMTLNMKNYKGFEKRPYCNAHCPQAKATTVADTPESRRLAENTRIQSQAKYHEDFEKSKGKGFTTVLDDPEMRRIKETSKIISNVAYHGDLERKKHMEEKRSSGGGNSTNGQDDISSGSQAINNNNNNIKHQNKMQSNSNKSGSTEAQSTPTHQAQQYHQQQQRLMQQQQQMQQQQRQQHIQKQQMLLKQQQQYSAQNNRQSAPVDGHHQQQQQLVVNQRNIQAQHQQYPVNAQQQQHQHQMMRQQQQQQQQIIMQQHHRQSMDPGIPMSRQMSKQAIISQNSGHPMMKDPNMVRAQNQAPIKYVPFNDAMVASGQGVPPHLIGQIPPQMMNHHPAQMGPVIQQQQNNRRVVTNPQQMGGIPQQHQIMHQNYAPNPVIGSVNGIMSKQSAASMGQMPLPAHMVPHHPQDQIHPLQMRPASFAGQPIHHQQIPNQVPRRVFRAMYDYVANDVDEVSFFENDILVDCVNVDRNWLIGKVARSGQTGMLPANYVTPELHGQ